MPCIQRGMVVGERVVTWQAYQAEGNLSALHLFEFRYRILALNRVAESLFLFLESA